MRLLSVLVTFNRLDYTKEALQSYLDTVTIPQFLVVVDNNSTDGTREWLLEQKKASKVDLLMLNKVNLYPGKACNQGWSEGLRHFDADFLHRIDNDEVFKLGWDTQAEAIFTAMPTLGQLGLLSIEGDEFPVTPYSENGQTINIFMPNIGGPMIWRRRLWDNGIRYREDPWRNEGRYTTQEDYHLSADIKDAAFMFGNVIKSHVSEQASGNWHKYPDYYIKTMTERGLPYPFPDIQ